MTLVLVSYTYSSNFWESLRGPAPVGKYLRMVTVEYSQCEW